MKDKHKAKRKYCQKCGDLMGETIDGKSICHCEVSMYYIRSQVEPDIEIQNKHRLEN